MIRVLTVALFLVLAGSSEAATRHWAAPRAPVIPDASGFVPIPGAAVPLESGLTYRAVFDARQGADAPGELGPAIDMAASVVNLLYGSGVPAGHVRIALVFHGDAVEDLYDETYYRRKHDLSNPNLKVLAELRKAGVELFVGGQDLAARNVDPATLSPDIRVALDAPVVLMTYRSQGYAVIEE